MKPYGIGGTVKLKKGWCAKTRERHQAGVRTKTHQFRWVKRRDRSESRMAVAEQSHDETMREIMYQVCMEDEWMWEELDPLEEEAPPPRKPMSFGALLRERLASSSLQEG